MNPRDADDLIDRFLFEELADNPVLASALGEPGHDGSLPDLSAPAQAARERREDGWIATMEALDPAGLTPDQDVDRRLVAAMLRGRRILRDWEAWRRQPDQYVTPGLQGTFTLFLHRLWPEAELVASAASRLRAVPELLDQARANLEPELSSPELTLRSLGQCRAAVRYTRELLPLEVEDPVLRATLAEAGEVAAGAYESFIEVLDELRQSAGGTHVIGEHRYTALLQQRELLDVDAPALRARGSAAYEQLIAEMNQVASRTDEAGAGGGDWRTAVDGLNADHPADPEEMRATYEDWTGRARTFLRERELVTLPEGEECRVVPSPAFQRPVLAVASYGRPPAYSASRQGHFWVPWPPDGTSDEEVQRRLETNNFSVIPAIAVHEAYPGHHWHLVVAKDNRRRVRSALSSAYFVEGWALYAELLMREHGFFTDRQLLGQLDSRLFRAARVVVDTSLHAGEMTIAEAVAFMLERTSLSPPTAQAEVLRYCAWPTQASSYLTGSLEIEKLRAGWDASGRPVREFHDRLAGSGCLPVPLAAAALQQ